MADILSGDFLRMIERLLVVSGAILSIYLGFRLFNIAQVRQDSSGRVKTKLFEFTAAKVGPGVFFAAFGAYVCVTSLSTPVRFNTGEGAPVTATAEEASVDDAMRKERGKDVEELKTLISNLPEEHRGKALALLTKVSALPATKISPSPKYRNWYGWSPVPSLDGWGPFVPPGPNT